MPLQFFAGAFFYMQCIPTYCIIFFSNPAKQTLLPACY